MPAYGLPRRALPHTRPAGRPPASRASLARCHAGGGGPLYEADHIVQHTQHCRRLAVVLAEVQAQPCSGLHLHPGQPSGGGAEEQAGRQTGRVRSGRSIWATALLLQGSLSHSAWAAHCLPVGPCPRCPSPRPAHLADRGQQHELRGNIFQLLLPLPLLHAPDQLLAGQVRGCSAVRNRI